MSHPAKLIPSTKIPIIIHQNLDPTHQRALHISDTDFLFFTLPETLGKLVLLNYKTFTTYMKIVFPFSSAILAMFQFQWRFIGVNKYLNLNPDMHNYQLCLRIGHKNFQKLIDLYNSFGTLHTIHTTYINTYRSITRLQLESQIVLCGTYISFRWKKFLLVVLLVQKI
jgi:hypothetical protein